MSWLWQIRNLGEEMSERKSIETVAKQFHDLYWQEFLRALDDASIPLTERMKRYDWDSFDEKHQGAVIFAIEKLVEDGAIEVC
jgi:hypothetical protein